MCSNLSRIDETEKEKSGVAQIQTLKLDSEKRLSIYMWGRVLCYMGMGVSHGPMESQKEWS